MSHAAAGQFFLVAQPGRFAAETRQSLLHDAVAGFDHAADVADAADDGVFERFRRNAACLAGVFAAFVLLPGADVVVVDARAAVSRRTNHVCPALAADQARKQVSPTLRLLEVHAAGDGLADLELHAVELLRGDDWLVAILLHRVAPTNLADVDRVAEDADYLLLDESLATALLVGAGAVDGIADAQLIEPPRHRAGRAEFLKEVENTADDVRSLFVDLQPTRIVGPGAIADDMPAVPQAPVGPVTHDREGALGSHFPLKLGEDHDELDHRFAGRHRGVELLPQGDNIHVMLGEERPQVHEVFEAAGNAVQFEADHQVDLARGDVTLQPLKLRAVLILRALAGIDVELQRLDFPVLTSLAEFDFLLDFVLLGHKAVTLSGLTLRGNPNIAGDSKWPAVFLVGFAHVIHLAFATVRWELEVLALPFILPGQSSRLAAVRARRARIPAISRTRLAARNSGADWAKG